MKQLRPHKFRAFSKIKISATAKSCRVCSTYQFGHSDSRAVPTNATAQAASSQLATANRIPTPYTKVSLVTSLRASSRTRQNPTAQGMSLAIQPVPDSPP